MPSSDLAQIEMVMMDYFVGLHHADVARLDRIFDSRAQLQAPGIRRSKQEWLAMVASRAVPSERGDVFAYRLLAIDLAGDQAVARVRCPLLGRDYIDFLSLLKERGHWRIVNKMYADTL